MGRVLSFHYVCPETERPIGVSVTVETIEEADEPRHIDECPQCGDEHYPTLDDLDPGGDGDDGAGVREPRRPPPDDGRTNAR